MSGNPRSFLSTVLITPAITFGAILAIELIGWLAYPTRYDPPPAVGVEAWIHSDGLSASDSLWMTEFVDEFCRSYSANWSSYVYFRRKPFAGRHINVDSAGLRATPQFALRSGQANRPTRIMLFGGSTMWGTGARDSATIPAALSRLIAANAPSASALVQNFGESGYVSTQSLLRLLLELRRGNVPDYVILYDGINDVFSAYQNHEAGLPQNESHRAVEFNLLKEGGRRWKIGLDSLYGRTVTASVVRSLRSILSPAAAPPPAGVELAGEIVRTYRANLEILEALSRQYGFRYTAYWQPVVFERKNPSDYERRQAELWGYVRPLFVETYRRIREDSTLRKNGSFHTISAIFDTVSRPVYLDFCHITEAGNAIVARGFYEDLKGAGFF
jgi:hypothetical protein